METLPEGCPVEPPLRCTGRAHDILMDMRKKRELLIANHPALKHRRPPKTPREKENSSEGSTRAKDILVDLKSKKASLSTVLDACKASTNKGSPRSEGRSTAPTAASTRSSVLSSCADDDSFCYSETSRDDTPGFEFIIDEESDLCTVSTKEEVERAVGNIYKQIIPKALSMIKKEEDEEPVSRQAYSWNNMKDLYGEESTRLRLSEKRKKRIKRSEKKKKMDEWNRDSINPLYISGESSTNSSVDIGELPADRSTLGSLLDNVSEMNESADPTGGQLQQDQRISESFTGSRKESQECEAPQVFVGQENARASISAMKKRRIRKSERRKEKELSRITSNVSCNASDDSSNEVLYKNWQPRRLAAKIKGHQHEGADMKTRVSDSNVHSISNIRRPRQDDSSFGSNPLSTKSHSFTLQKSSSKDLNMEKSKSRQKPKRKKKKQKKKSIEGRDMNASKIESERKVRISKDKNDVSKTFGRKKNSGSNQSDESLLVSPQESTGEESLLVSPSCSKRDNNNHSSSPRESTGEETLLVSLTRSERENTDPSSSLPSKTRSDPATPELKSDESGLVIFEDDIDKSSLRVPRLDSKTKRWMRSESQLELAPIVDAPPPKNLGSYSSRNLGSYSSRKKSSGSEFNSRSPSQKKDKISTKEFKLTYTIEDVMEEMNRLAVINANEGLKIPNGTVLTLRRHSINGRGKNLVNEDTYSGWSFSEPSDISTLGDDALSENSPQKSKKSSSRDSKFSDDITNRFCGGLYHLAVLSGMHPCEQEI